MQFGEVTWKKLTIAIVIMLVGVIGLLYSFVILIKTSSFKLISNI
jgi:hypothetical protein